MNVSREDEADLLFMSDERKWNAIQLNVGFAVCVAVVCVCVVVVVVVHAACMTWPVV